MALECSHLFAASLSLAASHRQSVGLEQSLLQIEYLRSASVKELRFALNSSDISKYDSAVATTLVLCMADIVAGGEKPDSWRVHLYGAGALLAGINRSRTSTRTPVEDFLKRLYVSINAIALSCGTRKFQPSRTPTVEETYIDDLAGYSTKLLPIFEEINDLGSSMDGHAECDLEGDTLSYHSRQDLAYNSQLLFDRVRSMLAVRTPIFRAGLEVSTLAQRDLYTLDEAYHHMALLQICRRGSLTLSLSVIQQSVRRIVACVSSMAFLQEPCPCAAALPPFFIAGCAATVKEDQEIIFTLMDQLWACFGMSNVKTAQDILRRTWMPRSSNTDENGADWDMLPY